MRLEEGQHSTLLAPPLWVVKEHTHEALVDEETYKQELLLQLLLILLDEQLPFFQIYFLPFQ